MLTIFFLCAVQSLQFDAPSLGGVSLAQVLLDYVVSQEVPDRLCDPAAVAFLFATPYYWRKVIENGWLLFGAAVLGPECPVLLHLHYSPSYTAT